MFALIVMVVAACEVVVGLGLIVAHVPAQAAARRRRDPGAAGSRVSATTWAWLVLAFPLAGSMVIAFGREAMPGKGPAGSGRRRSGSPSPARSERCSRSSTSPPTRASSPTRSTTTPRRRGLEIDLGILVDPLSVFMCLVVTGVSTLIHLYSRRLHGVRPRLRALLLLPQLLRLLDAAPGPRRQLRLPDRRLGVRRLRLLRADQLLVPARDRDQGGDEGVRDQRRRRRRAGARRLLRLPRARHLRLPAVFDAAEERSPPTRAWSSPSAC